MIIASIVFVFYFVILWLYLPAYKNRMNFAKYNLHNYPDSYTCYNWIGLMYKDNKRRYEALGYFFDGLSIRPHDFRLLFNTASILGELGRLGDAHAFYEKVKKSYIPDMLEEKMLGLVKEKQLSLRKAMEKAESMQKDWIEKQAKELRRGEKKQN